MNFGTIYIDFYEPIKLTQAIADSSEKNKALDPLNNRDHRLKFNESLGYQIVFKL